MNNDFRSGFVSLIGRPNVGKSTLMNSLIGEKIAIISSKPQTTRNKIQSILTEDNFQAIFIDTPGIHKPKSKLGNYMVKSAETTLNEVDIVLYLIEPFEKIKESDLSIIKRLENVSTPVFLVINKIDTVSSEEILAVIDNYKSVYNFAEIIPVSALKGKNKDELLKCIKKYLPEGPLFFPADMITDQPERQIVSEIIREKSLKLLQDEIPHGIAVEVSSMKHRKDKDIIDIQATIYCERDSHKGIIIGKQGSMLKKIGSNARYEIERLLGSPTNLQIWIKVKKDWRDSDFLLKNFGYDQKQI
ncbi:GTPase Era [uncultured Tyzzerella sp.]|uniref:GTPase Era n=1 Tax=uncultured Tyzzerella sp. TaxID=2321398 RepID=UPI0029421488|nr:GTPase Era [uncultured Tyzzerella sp.]